MKAGSFACFRLRVRDPGTKSRSHFVQRMAFLRALSRQSFSDVFAEKAEKKGAKISVGRVNATRLAGPVVLKSMQNNVNSASLARRVVDHVTARKIFFLPAPDCTLVQFPRGPPCT